MTVIFKYLKGRGDIPFSSLRRNQGLASGKALTAEGCMASSISAGGQGLHPRGAKQLLTRDQKKGKEGLW